MHNGSSFSKGVNKMTKSIVFRIVAMCVLVAALIGLGVYVYQIGVAHGLSGTAQLTPDQIGKVVPQPGMPYYYGRHMFGFGFFGLLMPLFLLFIVFWALRAIFGCHSRYYNGGYWGHPGWWGMHHMAGKGDFHPGVPPFFEEWHRQTHEGKSSTDTEDK
jgi:hypothetical protein